MVKDESEYVEKAANTEEIAPEIKNLNDEEKAFFLENAGEINYMIHLVHSDPLNGAILAMMGIHMFHLGRKFESTKRKEI